MSKFKDNELAYLPILAQAFASRGLPPELGPALARKESAFNPLEDNQGPGDKELGGSYGLCQMSFQTAKGLGYSGTPEGLKDPYINAALAAELCAINWKAHKNLVDVICMYNSGKPFMRAPTSTTSVYLPSVQSYMKIYRERCVQYAPSASAT